ncbi:MAG: class I SAM-dependent methyltransferase, partial [Polyangiales bacterium]
GVEVASVYHGVHQRLDRATSGLLVYARDKAANRSLAAQIEGRSVGKRYVAAVAKWPKNEAETTLRHHLAQGDDGRMVVAPAHDKRAQEAVTHAKVIERSGDRAIVELTLETGRTHQARAQLEAIGATIAGDRLYGRARQEPERNASRLLLHSHRLRLAHPIEGHALDLEAPIPAVFSRWLREGERAPITASGVDEDSLRDRLRDALEDRFALGRAGDDSVPRDRQTTAFRLVNEGGDGIPGLAVDVYGDHLVAHVYAAAVDAAQNRALDALSALGFEGIYVKHRPKQANTLVDARDAGVAPSRPIRGNGAPGEIEVLEHGVPYLARLGDGLSTGIFLDQRENRRRLRAMAAGRRVLNLFAYTCPFTVAAAVGGASRTVSVDASKGALDRGRRGLQHAGVDGEHHELIVDDVFAWLEAARKKKDRFDVVVLDPPSYSSVGATRFSTSSGTSGYRPLAALAMSLVAPDGVLLACSNHRQTVRAKLRRLLHEAARDANRTVAQMKDMPEPIDFPPPWGDEPHLKSVLVRLS